jgi:tetratricopeptide (TPR) repeat protein
MQYNSLRVFVTLVTTALFGASLAQAAPMHARKTGEREVRVKQTERSQGLVARPKSEQKKKRPRLTADDIIHIQGEVKNITNAKIRQYLELIAATDRKSKDLPDYMFRLADLYAQKQRYWRFRAMELYPEVDKASAAEKKPLKAKQQLYFKTEKRALMKSLAVYADLANKPRYRDYPRMDEVLFYFAHTLDGVKRRTESKKIYHQLITNHPNSKYIAQAYLSFADYFFEKGNLEQAGEFYDKVLKFPKSTIYPYALYKKGWVYLNQDRPQEALETFFRAANTTAGKSRHKTLNKAAKKDFVRAYALVGRAEKAHQAFLRVDKKYAFPMLKILGSIYLDQGKAKKAIFTYRQLISLKSRAPEVCEWQGHVVSAILSTGSRTQKSDEIVGLVKTYLAHKKAKILKGQTLSECRDNAQGVSGEMAKVWHSEAAKTRNPEALDAVERLYALYLSAFPSAEDRGQIHYYYADLLWLRAEFERKPRLATERWEKTATEVSKVVKGGEVRGKLLVDAAHAAAQGWKNALDVDPRTKPPTSAVPSDDAPIPTPERLSIREKKMLAAFTTYIKYASGDELVMMKFLRARIFWRRNRLKESLPFFYEIVKKHPEHETALTASHILIDSLIRLKKYDAMNKQVHKLLKNKKLMEEQPELVTRLHHLNTVYLRKKADKLREKGLFVACGAAYYRIFELNREQEGADEILYNAGTCFEEGKSIGLALRMFEMLSTRHPKSVHNQKALVRMGSAYGSIADYENAARKYEIYSKRYGLEKDAAGALQNAVTFRKGLGMNKEAIADIESFVKKYKKKNKEEAAAAMFGLAGIYKNQGNHDMESKTYKRYLSEIGKAGGMDRLLIANANIGEIAWKQSCKRSENGACVRIERERATRERIKGKRRSANLRLPTQCGPPSKIKLAVVPRDSRRVAEANKYLANALALAERGAVDKAPNAERKAAATYWMAASRFYMVGERYEKFLALEFPKNLSFSKRNKKRSADSTRRFNAWIADKTKLATEINSEYGEIKDIAGGGAAWAVAAAARSGQVSQNFSDGLFTATIPAEVRKGPYAEDAVTAYCDTLTTAAEPLEKQSLNAFGFCLNLSTKLNWFNRWSRLCEKELGQINPSTYPTATEYHGEANGTAAVTDSQGLITTISREGQDGSSI